MSQAVILLLVFSLVIYAITQFIHKGKPKILSDWIYEKM